MAAAAALLLRMGRLTLHLRPRLGPDALTLLRSCLRPEALTLLGPLLEVLLRSLSVHGRRVSRGTAGVSLSGRARRTIRSHRAD